MALPDRIQCEDRDTWLAERRSSVGASEAATVLGVNPYETPLELWARKRGEIPDKDETISMRVGRALEPAIAEMYVEKTGRKVYDPGSFTIYRHPDYPFIHATPDRIICTTEDRPLGDLQIKNVGARMAPAWEAGAPLYVQVQVQVEMLAVGLEWGSIAALLDNQQFWWGDQERNERFIGLLIMRCEVFMASVRSGIPPEPTADDTETLRLLYPKHATGKRIELPVKAVKWGRALDRVKREIKRLEYAEKALENRVKAAMGDAESGALPDGTGWTWRSTEVKGYTVAPCTRRSLRRV